MNLDEAKTKLDHFKFRTLAGQANNREIIVDAFNTFWDSKPTKEEFCKRTNGIMLFPEVLYEILKGCNYGKKDRTVRKPVKKPKSE